MNRYIIGLMAILLFFTSCKITTNHSVTITANYLSWGKGYSFVFIATKQGNIVIKDLNISSNNPKPNEIIIYDIALCNKLYSYIDEVDNIEKVQVGLDDYDNNIKIEYKNKNCLIVFNNNNYEAYNTGYNNSHLASVIKEIILYSLKKIEKDL